ncbi:hypothetical protein [Massilia sp. Mn16-1_5]|uniref:hypothetical protein n=1 Tax=Massilia sp. Mn16-1_5 TaxID=2079199 RepID=UPI00109E4E6A|nr:hypothetical protein [Massilia sp. Mn16-1_5]THC41342.1 hypothetical protein C2862_18730 [Massilia sp. Mn16-1_5]
MAGNKQYDAGTNRAGVDTRGPDSLSGRSDPANADTGQRQQDAGHYTGASQQKEKGDRDGGIVSAPPESNVGPAGAAQSDRAANAAAQQRMTAAAAGGRPGTSDTGNNADQSVDAGVSGTSVDELAKQTPDKPGGADSR